MNQNDDMMGVANSEKSINDQNDNEQDDFFFDHDQNSKNRQRTLSNNYDF